MTTPKRKISDIINGIGNSGDDYIVENIVIKNFNKALMIAVVILAAIVVILWYRSVPTEAPKEALDVDAVVMGCVANMYGKPADQSDNHDSYWYSTTASTYISKCLKDTNLIAYDKATGFDLSDNAIKSVLSGCIGAYMTGSNVQSYYARADLAICVKKANMSFKVVDVSTQIPEITQTPK